MPAITDPEITYQALLAQLTAGASGRQIRLVGIHSGGAWIAERLARDLGLSTEVGTLSSAMHRDDYSQRSGLPAQAKSTALPFDVDGADLVLVDDILFTGRTVRAALNELFDYGRPKRVELAVLLDRGGRELPIEAQYCGTVHHLDASSSFDFSRTPDGRFSLRIT